MEPVNDKEPEAMSEDRVREWAARIDPIVFGLVTVGPGLVEFGLRQEDFAAEFRVSTYWLEASLSNGFDFEVYDTEEDDHTLLDTCLEVFDSYAKGRYVIEKGFLRPVMVLNLPDFKVGGRPARRPRWHHQPGPTTRDQEA